LFGNKQKILQMLYWKKQLAYGILAYGIWHSIFNLLQQPIFSFSVHGMILLKDLKFCWIHIWKYFYWKIKLVARILKFGNIVHHFCIQHNCFITKFNNKIIFRSANRANFTSFSKTLLCIYRFTKVITN